MTDQYYIYPSEIEAANLLSKARGVMSTNDDIKADADKIILLAERIKLERLRGASEK